MSSSKKQSIASTSGAQNNNESSNCGTDAEQIENIEMSDDTKHAGDVSASDNKVTILDMEKKDAKKDPSGISSNFLTGPNQAKMVDGKNGNDNAFRAFRGSITLDSDEEEAINKNKLLYNDIPDIKSFGLDEIIADEPQDKNQQGGNENAFISFDTNRNLVNPENDINNKHNVFHRPSNSTVAIPSRESGDHDKNNQNRSVSKTTTATNVPNTENVAQGRNGRNNVALQSLRANGTTSCTQNEIRDVHNHNTSAFPAGEIIPNSSGQAQNNQNHNYGCKTLKENMIVPNREGRITFTDMEGKTNSPSNEEEKTTSNTEGRKTTPDTEERKTTSNTEGRKIVSNTEERRVIKNIEGLKPISFGRAKKNVPVPEGRRVIKDIEGIKAISISGANKIVPVPEERNIPENTERNRIHPLFVDTTNILNTGIREFPPNAEGIQASVNTEQRVIDQENPSYNGGNSGQNKSSDYNGDNFYINHQSNDDKYERNKMETEDEKRKEPSHLSESDDEEMSLSVEKILSYFAPEPPDPCSPMSLTDEETTSTMPNSNQSQPIRPPCCRYLECFICGATFNWLYSYQSHMELHDRDKPIECIACGLKIRSTTLTEAHWRQAHGDLIKDFKCDTCIKELNVSGKCVDPNSHMVAISSWICKFCNNRYVTRRALRVHYKVHLGKKTYVCGICDITLVLTSSAIAHQRTHTGVMPFRCVSCNNDFLYKNALSTHTCYHTEHITYDCKKCSKRFVSQKELDEHSCGQQEVKRYCCIYCGKEFQTQNTLNLHIRMHAGLKPYTCATCDERFSEKQELSIHLRSHLNTSIPIEPTVPDEYDKNHPENKIDKEHRNIKTTPHSASNAPALISPYNVNQNKMPSYIEIRDNDRTRMLDAGRLRRHPPPSYSERRTRSQSSQHLNAPLHLQSQHFSPQVSHGSSFTPRPSRTPHVTSHTSSFTPKNYYGPSFTLQTPHTSTSAPQPIHGANATSQFSCSTNITAHAPHSSKFAAGPPGSSAFVSRLSRSPHPTFVSHFTPQPSVNSNFVLRSAYPSNLVLPTPRATVFATQPSPAQTFTPQARHATYFTTQASHIPQFAYQLASTPNYIPPSHTVQCTTSTSNVPPYTPHHAHIQAMYANGHAAIMSQRSCVPNGNPGNHNGPPLNNQTHAGFSYNRNSAEAALLQCRFCPSLFHSPVVFRSHLLHYHRIDGEIIEVAIA